MAPARHFSQCIEQLLSEEHHSSARLALLMHELRSPLAAIQHAVAVLNGAAGENPAVRQRLQNLIERQVAQMMALTNSLLNVVRITHGQLSLRREIVDLRAIVADAIETLEYDIQARQQRLSVSFPELPVWLLADASRLEQVFVNLLANASKYTPPAGTVSVCMDLEQDHASVRIKDSGIGIADNLLPHIFDLFVQSEQAIPHAGSGVGIGLALVRLLVHSHDGSVHVTSDGVGQGSEFTVRLPAPTR
jgi:signal transduction histidine kinase